MLNRILILVGAIILTCTFPILMAIVLLYWVGTGKVIPISEWSKKLENWLKVNI